MLKKAIAKADAHFRRSHPDKSVTEFESYIEEVSDKFALEHTFKKTNDDEYFNEFDLFLLAKLATLHDKKTDELKECFLNQATTTMTVENINKAYGHTNYNFDNVLKMIIKDESLSSFFKCQNSSYVFKLLSDSIKFNGTQTKVSEFIHKLIQYRKFSIEQDNLEKFELEANQLQEKLIVSEYNTPPFLEGAKYAWHSVAIGLSSKNYKPKQILDIISRQNLMIDESITSDKLRSFLSRYNRKVTQKK